MCDMWCNATCFLNFLRCIFLSCERCANLEPYHFIPYIDREIAAYIDRHGAPAPDGKAQSIKLVRHIWRFSDGDGAPRLEDCDLLQCSAVPR